MNRKLSSFESINAKDINKDLTYVSAVQKLQDGSYKNINIPLAQLSGLWNDDVKTAVANADFEGGAIDAEVIHQAALNAVENALRDAKQSITEAVERANTFIEEVSSGNTATQQAIAEANEKVLQEINAGLDRLGEINTLYGNYFGPGGLVEQALNDANNELAISKDLLRDAQSELEALANGEITSTGIKNLEEKVNGLVTLVGLEGEYVDPDGKFANRVYEALNLAMGNKTFMLKNINGEDQTVTTFDQLINAVNGIYTTTLSRVNALSGDVTNMRNEWDVEKGKIEESISKNNFSDPNNQTVKQAVRTMTSDLIEQSVRKAVLDEIETITFLKTDPIGYVREITTPLAKETLYFLTWDKATDKDNPVLLEYQFVVLENGNEQPSETAYKQLTTEGIRSSVILSSSQSQEQGEEPEEENYTRKLYIRLATALEDNCVVSIAKQKYFSQSQISQTVDGVIISAVREELSKHNFSEFQVTDEYIQGVVLAYDLNNNRHFSLLKQDAEHISQSVNTFTTNLADKADKSEVNNSIEALQASIDVTDSKIDNTVSSYTCEIIDRWDESNHQKCIDDHQDESNNSIIYKSVNAINGIESAPNNVRCLLGLHLVNGQSIYLKRDHEYFLKIENISKIHYIILPVININNIPTIPAVGNIQTDILENSLFIHSTDNSNRINGLENDSVLYFYYECKYNNKTHQRVGAPNIQLLESVKSKFANFEITADKIKTLILNEQETDNGIVKLIYDKISKADGTSETIGKIGDGFLNQTQVEKTASDLITTITGLEVPDARDPVVRESKFKQSLDEIKSDVSRTQYSPIKNVLIDGNNILQPGPIYDGVYFAPVDTDLTTRFSYQLNNPNIENYPEKAYTIILQNFEDFEIAELEINNTIAFSKIPSTIESWAANDERRKLKPIVFNDEPFKTLAFKYYKTSTAGQSSRNLLRRDDIYNSQGNLITSGYIPKIIIGYPNSVAVSNIKQTADNIQLQVSNLEKIYDNLGNLTEKLSAAVQKITNNKITSTVAKQINGKLSGYSTIEQTKDYIASTVGGALVTNKFHDPLFKNGFGYWTRYPDAEMTTIDSPYTNIYRKFISPLSTYYQINNQYYDLKIERNPSIVFYDNLNTSGSGSQIKNCGVYTRVKLQPKQKYTASFYIKLSKNHSALKMNLGITDELAMNVKTFCIAPWDITKDVSYSPKLVKKTNVADWNNHASDELAYYEFDNFGSAEDISNSNRWCLSKNVSKPNDLKFGLWIDFYSEGLKNLVDELFKPADSNSNSSIAAPGPTSLGTDFRWFKIWFTFTADEKYYVKGDNFKNDSLFGLTKCDETFDRAFCFEVASREVAQNTYAQFYCEIAYPMLNVGTTPLEFSSRESISESYSTISQTNKSIEFSVNNAINKLTGELNSAGIKLDGENSRIEFNARTSAFTGAVNAESFKVTPKNSDSSIELVIYNSLKPEHAILNGQGFADGVPLLLARCGTDMYVINLTKLTGNNGTYWKINTDHPIRERVLYTGNPSNNYVFELSNKITFYQFTDNSVNIYSHKFICESEIELEIIGTIIYSGISSNKYFTLFNYNNSPQSIIVPLTGNKSKTITFKDKGCNPDLSDVINDKPVVSTKPFTYSLPTVNYGSYNTPILELGNYTGNPLYRISANNPHFLIDGKTKCGLTNIGTYRKCRIYRRMDNGVLIDFPEKRYCFIVEKNNTKRFVGFCGYNEILRRYNAYIDSQNPYSELYRYQSDRQKELGEYFVENGLREVSLDNRVSQDDYNSLNACNINNCKILFTESEITKFEEVLNRGVLLALGNDYFRKVD